MCFYKMAEAKAHWIAASQHAAPRNDCFWACHVTLFVIAKAHSIPRDPLAVLKTAIIY